MKRIIVLFLIATFLIAILLFIYNPGALEKVWLWIVGLIGVIISTVRNTINGIINFFKEENTSNPQDKPEEKVTVTKSVSQTSASNISQTSHLKLVETYEDKIHELEGQIAILQNQLKNSNSFDGFNGITLTVLRYFDDGETTLGLLFYEDDFFCYTLEDTYREVKKKGQTRIPQGIYKLGFNKNETKLTLKYRKTRPWFEYHLHVKNVPNYTGIYIHVGNTTKDTEGCLLVADSINSSDASKSIFNSRETFKKLYLKLKPYLDNNEPVRIRYYNEDWFQRFKLKKIVA